MMASQILEPKQSYLPAKSKLGGEIPQRIEEFSAEWYLIRYEIIATSGSVDKLLQDPREMHQNEEIIFPKSKKADLAENH